MSTSRYTVYHGNVNQELKYFMLVVNGSYDMYLSNVLTSC